MGSVDGRIGVLYNIAQMMVKSAQGDSKVLDLKVTRISVEFFTVCDLNRLLLVSMLLFRGKCREGKCLSLCEYIGLQSCICDKGLQAILLLRRLLLAQ